MDQSQRNSRQHQRHISRSLTLSLLLCLMAGCQSTPTTGGTTLNDANAAYAASRYSEAQSIAERLITGSATQRAQASYIAGKSAYRLGRTSQAESYLLVAADSTDRTIAGPAYATLGLIAAGDGRYELSIDRFRKAIPLLSGEDVAQAYYHLAVTEQKNGQWSAARAHLVLADRYTGDRDLKSLIDQRRDASGFTLQLGAYRDLTNAQQRATQYTSRTSAAGLGIPEIRVSLGSGNNTGTFYLVQVGRFADFNAAQSARTRVDGSAMIVPMFGY